MGFFWMFQGHIAEGREWLERAIGAAPAALSSLTATATAWAAQLAGDQYDYQKAVTWAAQSLEVFRGLEDHWGIGFCSLILGNQSLNQDELEAASRLFEESHAHFRLSGSRPDLAKSLDRLGCVKWMKGDYDEAARLLSESRDLSSSIGNHWYAATAMVNLSRVALSQGSLSLASKLLGESLPMLNELNDVYHACMALHMQAIVARREKDYPRALLLLEQSAAPLRELGDPVFLNYCLGERGVVRWLQGSLDEALMLLRESATVSLQLRDKSGCAMWVEALGGVCLEMGEPMWAAKLFGAAEAMREQIGRPLAPHEQADHNSRVARLPSRRGRADVQNAWNFGRAEPLECLMSSLSELIDGRDALRDSRSQGSKRPVGAGTSGADQRDKVNR
jgi:tetratricopeptide (TPR) repeat protein